MLRSSILLNCGALCLGQGLTPPLAASFVIISRSGLYEAWSNASGAAFYGPDAAAVINAAIAALPEPHGGTVLLRAGSYTLTAPISIERSSVTLRGESTGGDLFFTADGTYHGVLNKSGAVLVALSGDAITVGLTRFVFGVAVQDLFISGVGEGKIPDEVYSAGAGVRAERVDTLQLSSLEVVRKEFGVLLGPVGPFAFDNVQDVVTIQTLYLAYNLHGLWARAWVCNVRLRGLFGYLNQFSLLYRDGTVGQYDWQIDGVMSQVDGWNSNASSPGVIYLAGCQETSATNIYVGAAHHGGVSPQPLISIVLEAAGDAGGEWYRGHIRLSHVTLFSTSTAAIRVSGRGMLDISDLHVGSTGSQAFPGGNGSVGAAVVALGPDTDVVVTGGFANASAGNKGAWFAGVRRVAGVRGYNPLGRRALATPFDAAAGTLGPGGSSAAPVPAQAYVVHGVDVLVAITGARSPLLVTVYAPTAEDGVFWSDTVSSLSPMLVPVGYAIAFGDVVAVNATVVVTGN